MDQFLKTLKKNFVILGTTSVYRQDIFRKLQIPFEVVKSDFQENLDKTQFSSPQEYCLKTCELKASDIFDNLKEKDYDLLVTFDTICIDQHGKILEKPKSQQEHLHFLRSYSNSYLDVATAQCIYLKSQGKVFKNSSVRVARVHWDEFPEEFPEFIISHEDYMKNCCGGFGLEGLMNVFVKKIEGDFQIIIGLSVKMLIEEWFSLWQKAQQEVLDN